MLLLSGAFRLAARGFTAETDVMDLCSAPAGSCGLLPPTGERTGAGPTLDTDGGAKRKDFSSFAPENTFTEREKLKGKGKYI